MSIRGKRTEITMNPTINPIATIMIGSRSEVICSTRALT